MASASTAIEEVDAPHIFVVLGRCNSGHVAVVPGLQFLVSFFIQRAGETIAALMLWRFMDDSLPLNTYRDV